MTDTLHNNDYRQFESKTRLVVIISALTMAVEITFGYLTNSIALLADGYHMASHVLALGLSWLTYVVARKYAHSGRYVFNKEKLMALTGFSSALLLQVIAIIMAVHSVERLIVPLPIRFGDAIVVAFIGLVVNVVSAFILHHKQEHSDHNIRSAYLHVLADGLTSLTAIVALTAGLFFDLFWLDAISGIISSMVITNWAVKLIFHSGKTLIEFTNLPKKEEKN